MKAEEVWADVPGFSGKYQASTYGNLRNSKINLKQTTNFYGYRAIGLVDKEKRFRLKVHRIIAITFIPNPENKRCVNHKNGIKTDNHIDNLEWCTHA